MDWTTPVDIYCERLAPGFWAEPVNAISNAAFLIAAIWAGIEARRRAEPNPLVWLLIVLAACIGIGSFLFHTFANKWSELADVGPIWTFVALYCLVAAARLGRVQPGRVVIAAVALTGLIALILAMGEGQPPADPPGAAAGHGHSHAPDPFNGSLQYLPAVIALAIFAIITQIRRHPLRRWVQAAGVVFLISLVMRTIDRDICTAIPLGTHFLWHLLNGLLIGLVLQILIRSPRLDTAPS